MNLFANDTIVTAAATVKTAQKTCPQTHTHVHEMFEVNFNVARNSSTKFTNEH